MKKIILFACSALLLLSCEKAVLGPDEANDPENNFEVFWQDFDRHYGLFTARGWDWDSIYQVYRPQVTAQTTETELWNTFVKMIDYLDDGHTYIYDPNHSVGYGSGNLKDSTDGEFDLDLVKSAYLSYHEQASENIDFFYGQIKNKDIGYIFIQDMDNEDPAKIDEVLAEIRDHQAIIFDIRDNNGGFDQFAARMAGSFADGEKPIYTVQERNGPEHNDFAEKRFYSTEPAVNPYLKPVILLTDRETISAAEIFLLHMKAFDHVVQIGDSTAGDFSDGSMRRFLPNGWIYQYSIMMYLTPDGSSLDGIGHVPDVQVRNTRTEVEAGTDKVLETAIQYLFDEYGIE